MMHALIFEKAWSSSEAMCNNVEAILSGKGNDGEETAVGCTKRSVT